jgi:leucyl-tRNA synthetase
MVASEKVCDVEDKAAAKLGHRLIDGVARDINGLLFNTAIAKMMEFVNDFTKLSQYPRSILKMAVQALSPFAPHIAEELWEMLGAEGELSYTPWPELDPKLLEDEEVTYVVQVNGKLRGRFDLPKDQDQETILNLAQEDERVSKHVDGKTVVKVIFVPNKLLNLVVK